MESDQGQSRNKTERVLKPVTMLVPPLPRLHANGRNRKDAVIPLLQRQTVQDKNAQHSECMRSKGSQSSHHLRGAVFAWKRFPRVRTKRVPGANVRARLRRGQPEGLQGT